MKPGSIPTVPAGKKPRVNSSIDSYNLYKQKCRRIIAFFRGFRIRGSVYLVGSTLAVLLLLGIYDYLNKFVYVVLLGDREVGVVEDARDLEAFLDQLTLRCVDLYGMHMEPGVKIDMVKEFRPDSKANEHEVQNILRQQVSFKTEAYLITVEGKPLVPVASPHVLAEVIVALKNAYYKEEQSSRLLDALVIEDLNLEACTVSPDLIHTAEEVVDILLANAERNTLQSLFISENMTRGGLAGRYATGSGDFSASGLIDGQVIPEGEGVLIAGRSAESNVRVKIKTVEELTVLETIPFPVEYLYDEEMWIVQSEITTPGLEGKKEIVYHVTRENGVEVERIKILETVLEEPGTQVETRGTAQVPSVGTGQFIWPVEDGGEVTPGRGFSAWHTGIDIHADKGANILAADYGVVWFSGRGGSQGNYLIIYHGDYWTLYLHNQQNLVHEGMEVAQGDVIATVGSTGRSTGPHLHFEIRVDDGTGEWIGYYQHEPIDPLQFFRP